VNDPKRFKPAILHPLVLSAAIAAMLVTGVLIITSGEARPARSARADADTSLTDVERAIGEGVVTKIEFGGTRSQVVVTYDDASAATIGYPQGYAPMLTRLAHRNGVEVSAGRTGGVKGVALLLVLGAGAAAFLVVQHKRGALPGTGLRTGPATPPTTRFGDVAGQAEVLEELQEVVRYLMDPDDFGAVGATPPKGVLLVGPPGTGKTLLARAVAGEAGVPFFAASGADFVEKYVGVGASRVRGLFDKARKAGKAIIFIDEVDAVGRARGGDSNDESERTLNQLLVELDGFEASDVVVIAATNRPDVLDDALLRPGRFDRQVTVGTPDRAGREAILAVHTRGRPLAGVDLALLSRRTPGFTGADLANLVNQAALSATRTGAQTIGQAHFDDAIATVMVGPERRSAQVLLRDREITAWHEAGHTIAALVQPHADPPAGVSIVPRGPAGGVTWMTGDDHQFLLKPQAHAQLVVAMAGRAAEEAIYGASYTQGASGDLRHATQLATRMAADYGMSHLIGPMHLPESMRGYGETGELLRRAVRELLEAALADARTLVADHRNLLDAVAEALLEHDTLDRDELVALSERVLAAAA
jgi:cell division protease FtsH